MLGALKYLFGGQSSEQKSAKLKSAEACFTNEELQTIKAQYAKALQSQGADSSCLQERAFVQNICGLPASDTHCNEHRCQQAGLVGKALFIVCCGISHSDDESSESSQSPVASNSGITGISIEDLIVAKAACDRQGTESSQLFTFKCLCALADLCQNPTKSHSPTDRSKLPQTLTPAALQHAVVALCSLLMLDTTGTQTTQPSGGQSAESERETAAVRKQAESEKEETAVRKEPAEPATTTNDSVTNPEQDIPVSDAGQSSLQANMKDEDIDRWAAAVSTGALWCAAGPAAASPASCLDYTGYVTWVKMCKTWQALLAGLLQNVGKQLPTEQIGNPPRVLLPSTPNMVGAVPAGLLNPLAALLLSYCMPEEHRKEWKLLFNGHHAGRSFNTLMGRLNSVEGATLMLVREAGPGGHLVAGYAPAPWRKNGTYYGEQSTWVARLQPDFQVFYATGVNTNYQWCGQGFSQLPNGLGFGGAQSGQRAFALLLDGSLETGQSRPIATFGSPSLTKDQVFKIDTVEVWLVRQPEEEELAGGNHAAAGTSALDKANTDRVILGLAGKAINHSDGYRGKPAEPIE